MVTVLARNEKEALRIAKLHFGANKVKRVWPLKKLQLAPPGMKEYGVQIEQSHSPRKESSSIIHVRSHTRKGTKGVKAHSRRR